jgi:hypothetical protein
MAVGTSSKRARWWDSDATQRYWMEVVHVEEFGEQLVAPEESRHDRMHDVRTGDVVLHWVSKRNPMKWKPGIYGASVVAGELQPNGGTWLGKPANTIALAKYKALREPYLLGQLQANHQEDILGILEGLTKELVKRPKQKGYFPFNRHSTIGLKPNEGYLFKLPRQVIAAVPELLPPSDWAGFDHPLEVSPVLGNNGARQRYAGFCADPIVKKAIETQAVRQAMAHFESVGYDVQDVGAFESYDLRAVRGNEVRYVEVKGSQGAVSKVILTRNEVTHANEYGPTDLVIVAEIEWEPRLDGSVSTSDGIMSVHSDWLPSPENLKPLSYEYFLD